ncbi:MAG: rod shape-determining protein MreC [Alphaproteobacteria bacterium]|nr:rod shape-determining protein MreC [Alphaproteobacteria bacterium]
MNFFKTEFADTARHLIIKSTVNYANSFDNMKNAFADFKSFMNHDYNRRILKLHEKNQKLLYEIENLKHLESENSELRQLLELKQNIQQKILIAQIISVFSNDYIRSCVLNVGSADGVEIDDIVRNHKGFIGRISDVQKDWSTVLLITDTNSKLSVKIGKDQINAIVSGDNSENLSISMKNEDTMIKEGDIAETAYLENPKCDKIPVGEVFEKHGAMLIKPFVNFNALHYVCILKNK